MTRMEQELSDRRFDAVLERLDRIAKELARLNARLERDEGLVRIQHELANLNESLQALAYAALGQQGPQIRRRRAG
jgi:predicted nuclease with TOPRIM domain